MWALPLVSHKIVRSVDPGLAGRWWAWLLCTMSSSSSTPAHCQCVQRRAGRFSFYFARYPRLNLFLGDQSYLICNHLAACWPVNSVMGAVEAALIFLYACIQGKNMEGAPCALPGIPSLVPFSGILSLAISAGALSQSLCCLVKAL